MPPSFYHASCYEEDVSAPEVDVFERAKPPLLLAAVGIAVGLAVAGSVEKTVGGVIVVAAWVLGIGALHRLGRAGSTRRG
jgi:hypothetical protein